LRHAYEQAAYIGFSHCGRLGPAAIAVLGYTLFNGIAEAMPGYESLCSVAAIPSVFLNPLSIVRDCGFQLGNRVICRSRAKNALDGWWTTVNNPCLFNEIEIQTSALFFGSCCAFQKGKET